MEEKNTTYIVTNLGDNNMKNSRKRHKLRRENLERASLLIKYLLSKRTKVELQASCEENGLSKSGTKSSIIHRLFDSIPSGELFHEEPIQMLDWYEKLFLASLLDGPKRRSGIIEDVVFVDFLGKIDAKQENMKVLCLDIFRLGKKNLVGGGLVLYDPQTRTYSILPDAQRTLIGLKELNIDEIVEGFNNSSLRTLYDWTWRRNRNITIEIPIDEQYGFFIEPEVEVVKYSEKKPIIVSPNQEADLIRILAFSDWRVQKINDIFLFLQKIEPVDFIVYTGDDIRRFQGHDANYFSELSKSTTYRQVLAVLGNDDSYSNTKSVLHTDGVIDLYDQSFIFKNFAFIGLESSTRGPALFRHEEDHFRTHLETQRSYIKEKRLIVISHTPPFGILDRGIRFASEDEATHHIGSTALKDFIETQNVDLVVCGHCHSHGGMIDTYGDTTIVNVSSHDNPGSKGNFAIIELSKDGLVSIDWHDTTEVLDMNSPIRIHGIGSYYCEALERGGIKSIGDLAEAEDYSALSIISDIPRRLLSKFQLKAKSMINNETYQIATFNLPTNKLIFFDIETDTNCERVWLIGTLIDGEFRQLYADNWEQEKTILEEFTEILKQHSDRTLVSYSCTNFDHRITLGALERHGLNAEFLESFPHVDLGTLLNRCFIFPNQKFALKDLGTYLEYPFRYPDMDGLAVALSYQSHVEDGKPLDPKIYKYNEDDVRAIPYLIEKAHSLEESALKSF